MSETGSPNGLKWDQRQRLALFEAALVWRGEASTRDLIGVFGISRAQASADIALYRHFFPRNLAYNATRKRFEPGEAFAPGFVRGGPEELALLQAGAGAGPTAPDALVLLGTVFPPVAVVRPVERAYDVDRLRRIARAIRERALVLVPYQSLNQPARRTFRLWPHALVFNGFRWHARAYSETHAQFRDFVVARMGSIETRGDVARRDAARGEGARGEGARGDGARPDAARPDGADPVHDDAWNTQVTVRIGPHPGLTPEQQQVVGLDHGMRRGELQVPLRGALITYFLRLMRLDGADAQVPAGGASASTGGTPHDAAKAQQIVVLNPDEIAPYRFDLAARP